VRHRVLSLALLLLAPACTPRSDPQPAPPSASATAGPQQGAAADTAPAPASATPPRLVQREGQALARAPAEDALYLADEDHSALRRIALTRELTELPPLPDPKNNHDAPKIHFGDAEETHVDLPGRPAQVVALADRVLVTVRDPGLLLVFSTGKAMKEIGRVAVPADAWGLAVSSDASSAYVTSAWTHKLTRVGLGAMQVAWSIDVAREPRGVTVTEDGRKVYVSHLVGAALTRVLADKPDPSRIDLAPDPLRTFAGDKTVGASLGYAAILSPDGRRLFAARQALGALWSWQGNGTVDVLETAKDEPIAAVREGKPFGQLTATELKQASRWWDHGGAVAAEAGSFVQPRAMVYRARTRHLLVADEGLARLAELDAMSVAPGLVVNRFYRLGGLAPEEPTKIQIPPHCGAPTGIALSADEMIAWVYCRSTDNVVAVRLTPDGARGVSAEIEYIEGGGVRRKLSPWGPFAYARLPVAAAPEPLALGRRLFYDATEPVVSQEMACAGCHPEGRDDGHVWHEIQQDVSNKARFVAGPSVTRETFQMDPSDKPPPQPYGAARQTPMLAGRVKAVGPYGWHAESATLVDRIKAGFSLHRQYGQDTDGATLRMRADPLATFLREGLVPPPREAHDPTPEEEKGKAIFLSARAQCATCHVPATDFTDRSAVPLRGFKTARFFDEDPKREYKVPSLLYVGGTPPYYHDGSAATLEELVDKDQDRMGHTTHLSDEERAALVAYLRTL
jgi:DNA-binding beta-propeller fold protein YncE